MKPKCKKVADQPSWILSNDQVSLAVTVQGGQMAPVTFYRGSSRPIQPYYISPWQGEGLKINDPVLVPLRGDFFCFPFGGDNTYGGEKHVCHGEPATARWKLKGLKRRSGVTRLTLTMKTKVRPGRATKRLKLVDGQNVVYTQHVLEGYTGRTSIGHHATLAVPDAPGSMRVAVSPWRLGMTCPDVFGNPTAGEYQSLAAGERFTSLSKVPLCWKDPAYGDCSAFPVREGFTDLLAVFAKQGASPAWSTATVDEEGYVWFALRDPAMLPSTILWISNHGRHAAPWNGRNRCLGVEDVCGYFAHGLGASLKRNLLNREGIPTAVRLSAKKPTVVNYIQGVVQVPRGFQCVRTLKFAPGEVTFVSVTGKRVTAPVHHEFLATGKV